MRTGLFIQSYKIASKLLGTPTFEIHLAVNAPQRSISGPGFISNNSTRTSMKIYSNLSGEFNFKTVTPDKTQILVHLKGSASPLPIVPIKIPNIDLSMILESDWQTGTATYSYMDERGNWNEIKDAKVTAVSVEEPITV